MSYNKIYSTIDGNEAAAYVMYRVNEVCCIYPITPSSPMAELADEWCAKGIKNIWGNVPSVSEFQSEGGAAGAVHGALQAGTLTTTFTASQGLLLKIPNMYKIAGEFTPTVFNVSARTLSTHALSIFGDHSDIMAARQTGFAFLGANSVQEVMDMALIAQASTLESRVPFLHWFDGFRTSHEVQKIEMLNDNVIRSMIDDDLVLAHRNRSLNPDRPVIRGTSQNPDVFFQHREAGNKFHDAVADIIQKQMDKFAKLTGRHYHLFDYEGAKDAKHIVVIMGSGAETVADTVEFLNAKKPEYGVVKVRVYRPFDAKRFLESLPETTKSITVLDRTKECGANGEPLYMDVITALQIGINKGYGKLKKMPKVVGGRYGLSSKDFTPAMVKAVFTNASKRDAKNSFTIGIEDDVTNTSLQFDERFNIEPKEVIRAMFYGLGSDGTVGANKNSIKIIGNNTDLYAQGYFVYDSKKSGAMTVSHLRFGPKPIRSPYIITHSQFVACHETSFIERYNMCSTLVDNGIFLINTSVNKAEVWNSLPRTTQKQIIEKHLKVYAIDAIKVAEESGMGRLINTIMQVCFFAISNVLPREQAIEAIKKSIIKTYSRKGDAIVQKNLTAVDNTLANLYEVKYPNTVTSTFDLIAPVTPNSPAFVKNVLGEIIAGNGDKLPVSAFPNDGTYPLATSQYEKRNIALEIPEWSPETCIQCLKCNSVCPHAAIRGKVYDANLLQNAPAAFKSIDVKDKNSVGKKFTIQIAPEDCTGCGVCVEVCPGRNKENPERKAINMVEQNPIRHQESKNFEFFLTIPDADRTTLNPSLIRSQQLMRPLFEFSGACAGCGETPYIKMVSQLFGDRAVVANATGCSSIYGGNLPTTPWAKDANGRGPAWSNSLFEDNAEFGLGMRISIDKQHSIAVQLLKELSATIGDSLVNDILNAEQATEMQIAEQRDRIKILREKLQHNNSDAAKHLLSLSDYLVKKSVWIIGGDGWAYDIGFGGLDHAIASGKNINILVLDTEVYSNTGGQNSKSTPIGAIAKFAMGGKDIRKKDLGMIAMSYGYVYVASIALGARDDQALKAIIEAEAYDGPSIIIAYSHCIAHGIDMSHPLSHQKMAVDSGQWLLYRYNPTLADKGGNPLVLDSKEPKIPVIDYLKTENRFNQLIKSNPTLANELFEKQQRDINARYQYYKFLSERQ
ncbi:MAG: pyruvate:ferredoxin (flavodoxin) oxidoreductase [Ignavibacteria bacterium]|jgi:pyruvate-ferredoxin/flavodoxin oxidoreductase|nr:pyruvate:ferredoxin (flavodoxin) oxidoreductase [Ignavibacteria bacterium]